MVGKLEGNGLWEGSRMIMPEHKARILDDAQMEEIRTKPELDPQALEEIQRILAKSIEDHSPIILTLFDPVDDKRLRGIVMRVDQQLHQIKLRTSDEDWEWIKIGDVIDASS